MLSVIMLNVTVKSFKLSVVKLNVVMTIVVAPFVRLFLNYLNFPARPYTTAKGGFLIIHA
jgi:hypothetical protein